MIKRQNTLSTLFALSLLLSVSGCSLFGRSAPPSIPLDDYRAVLEPERSTIINAISRRASMIKAGRVLLQSTLRKSIERQRFKQVMVFVRPDRLRVEFFAPGVNQLSALLAVHGATIRSIDLSEKKFYEGSTSLKNAERLLSIPFYPEEIMTWLSGSYTPGATQELLGTRVFVDAKHHSFVADYLYRNDRLVRLKGIRINRGRDVILQSISIERSGTKPEVNKQILFNSEFEYPGELEGMSPGTRPLRIKFWIPPQEISGDLEVDSFQDDPNPFSLGDQLFKIEPPRGYKIIELE